MTALEGLYLFLGLVAFFAFLILVVLWLVYLERKFLGRIQNRLGPMRTGPWGLLQTIADSIKLVTKESLVPRQADRFLFTLAPVAVFVPSFMVWVSVPFTRELVLRNLDMGLFYIVAISVVSVVGLVMAGWASANKYALLGGLRAAAALISYEVPIILAILGVSILAQSLRLTDVVAEQSPVIYALTQPLGLFIFALAGLAEIGRTPFDIQHAESEVVGGPFIEYSGVRWAIFYMAEYVNTFIVAVLLTLLFLGGWRGPLLPDLAWFFIKVHLVVLAFFWFRGTFPRLRIDQLVGFAWVALIPLGFVNIVLAGAYLFYGWPLWLHAILSWWVVLGASVVIYRRWGGRYAPAALTAAYARRAG